MKHPEARQIGQDLQSFVARLRQLAQEERARRGPDAEALDIALVNLDSAVEILTE